MYFLYGLFLLIVSFLPLELIFGEIKGYKGGTPPEIWLLSISIIFLANWLILALVGSNVFDKLSLKITTLFKKIPTSIFFILIGIFLTVNQIYIFEHKPLLIDSVVQLFQAEIFSFGQLKAKLPPIHEFFVTQHMLFDDWSENGRCGPCRYGWFGQYPPGHSLILALGLILKSVWLVPIILSLLSSYIIYKFCRNAFGENVSRVCLFLTTISPFFIFMGSSFMNHTSTLLLISLSIYYVEKYEKSRNRIHFYLLVLFLSLVLLIRPLDALAIGIVLIPFGLSSLLKDKVLIPISLIAALPSVLAMLLYNKLTTGEYLLAGYIKLWGSSHNLGFHMSPWGEYHTPITGLRNELVDLQLLQDFLYEWPIPALLPLSILLIFANKLGIKINTWEKRLLSITIIFPVLYFFYWHRDAFLGPRFLYSSLIAWIPLTSIFICRLLDSSKDKSFHIFNLLKPIKYKHFIGAIFISCIIYSTTISIPARFNQYMTGMKSMKIDLVKEAKKAGIERGLIFIKSSWGVRIFSRMRGLGISASDSQIAYSNIDHCYLDELVKEKSKEKIQNLISSVIKEEFARTALTVKYNFDPSMKLDPNRPLTRICKEEILYDLKNQEQDYTIYEPHMRVNTPKLDGNFIVVKDLRELNVNLISLYPNYEPYIFNGEGFSKVVHSKISP